MVGGTSGKLTDKGIKSFIARKVIGSKLADGQGLYLLITRAKTASWRIKYRIEGREKSYTIGTYPQSSLAQARFELMEVKLYAPMIVENDLLKGLGCINGGVRS